MAANHRTAAPTVADHRQIADIFKRCRIQRLTVVAGPPAVGKSHLIRTLHEDDHLRERLGIPEGTLSIKADLLRGQLPSGAIDHLVLEYSTLRPFRKSTMRTYERDPVTLLFRCAETISFLTIRMTPELLCIQLDRRIRSMVRRNKPLYRQRLQRQLRPLYQDDRFLDEWYERWLTFVAGFEDITAGNYLVSPHEGYALTPADPRPAVQPV